MNATSFKTENLPANKTTVQESKVKKEIPDGINHSNYNKQGGSSAQSVVAPTSPQRETKPAKKFALYQSKKFHGGAAAPSFLKLSLSFR
ncbi:hypothetical protein CEXT_605951 [Caerostris extrusa]|uniref:Uncharacterized protein n=1 Tax=Caerostris extrusa TaxID=172846 RepID=A0AAV4PXA6_CAEEX|nr:hypothetical protein CEXT_605951 [Caerostris extrusa]